MPKPDLSAQPDGSGIVDVGAATAGRAPLVKPPTLSDAPHAPPESDSEDSVAELAPDTRYDLPEGLAESFALLKQIEGLPEDSPDKQRRKAEALKIIKPHIFKLQQGPMVTIHPTATELAPMHQLQAKYLPLERLKAIGREHPLVAELLCNYTELLDDYNRVVAEVNALRSGKE